MRYNPTTYEYYINKEALQKNPPKKLIIATVNVSGEPTRSILRDSVPKVDGMVESYLEKNGYEIIPNHHFENAWRKAILTYGDFYDPTTGKIDARGWQLVMAATLTQLKEEGKADAVLFTDLIEHDVQHSPGMTHNAQWYGITREPATEGSADTVSVEFDWTQIIKGASLMTTLYSLDGAPLFSSRGGIDTLYAIDKRRSEKSFVRKKRILSRENYIEEGIELAMHPLIKMEKWPGKKEEAK
ncbi:hypothetical protein NCG89_16560 [Spongiibacter taiwanensis]|uniref:hypothetical protein n=1 Tax=Spongiibacter taiwanensis TaxID=1748242 RepID=UPI002035DB07|nr:hypothetical protein [Spongiibacter taiwanensis]USA43135.1 hypothetical protein NCG89_16560 [Spongiibacter taiwanensis]